MSNDKLMEECEKFNKEILTYGFLVYILTKITTILQPSFQSICVHNLPELTISELQLFLLIYRNYYDRVPAEISNFFTFIIKKYITSHCSGLNFHQFDT